MRPVVSNSSPLIALARIQRLDLVPTIFESVLIPPAVAGEIRPSIPVLPDWLRVRAPTGSPSMSMSRGAAPDAEDRINVATDRARIYRDNAIRWLKLLGRSRGGGAL